MGSASGQEGDICQEGTSELVEMIDWTSGTMILVNHSPKPIVMIEAEAMFVDPLGTVIGDRGHPIVRDMTLKPGLKFTQDIYLPGFERLDQVDRDLVDFALCTTGVVYADGTVEKF
ncbi:hypothetical protein VE25_07360 [Devosia geojensis]|uniref:Uncharacterized protein n=2 Tax=Devosia geojensis TaxID=443610 RepID=A0A0F5FU14_9HYPH|nr:hypothetical protein VE25_07360 [Devosia geojensis]